MSAVLVLAHRGELLDQAAEKLRAQGLTVAVEQGAQHVDRSRLPDAVVASVQTMQGKRLAEWPPTTFGLIVVDEAHHGTAPTYRNVLAHFAAAKVLGVTATPERADGVGLRNVFESCAYRMDLAAGIRAGWLAPIELRSVTVKALDLSRVRSVAGDLHVGELEAELMRDRVLHELARPLADLSARRQTLAFVAGVQQGHALADVLRGYGVRASAVDGSMSAEARAAIRADFASGRVQMVCNAQLWTEGFDEPATSCVALVRPTRSVSLLTQMIGRGTRLHDGKTSCLVLDFVPGRAAKMRLAAPADVLAGEELPESLLERVRVLSGLEAGDLDALLTRSREDQERADKASQEVAAAERDERRRLVREVGVIYMAARMDVEKLLEAVREPNPPGWRPDWKRRPASPSQLAALKGAGLEPPDGIDVKEASALLDVVGQRRRAGLCTIPQAKKLRGYGLRDDVTFTEASKILEAIAANRWRYDAL